MAINKRKKNTRQRAGTTHGWGSMKKHRGAGHRGGRGRAGTGKRGDAKKPSFWKNKKYFGVNGFHSISTKVSAINLKQVDDNADAWAKKGIIKADSGVYTIDLKSLGYGKLLGTGRVMKKLNIKVDAASQKAQDKVGRAGGKLTLAVPSKEE
ncbi:MAG: uL15m family ribosomal protein [Candidatus Nanoarchaeia archaeon]